MGKKKSKNPVFFLFISIMVIIIIIHNHHSFIHSNKLRILTKFRKIEFIFFFIHSKWAGAMTAVEFAYNFFVLITFFSILYSRMLGSSKKNMIDTPNNKHAWVMADEISLLLLLNNFSSSSFWWWWLLLSFFLGRGIPFWWSRECKKNKDFMR